MSEKPQNCRAGGQAGAPGRDGAAIRRPATAWRPIPPSWETLVFSLKAFNPLDEAHLQCGGSSASI